VVRLSALHTGCLNPPENIPGTHFCWRLSQPQDHSPAGRIMSMKNSNDTTGNRTRFLPACSAVPQPTALPRAPHITPCAFWFYSISRTYGVSGFCANTPIMVLFLRGVPCKMLTIIYKSIWRKNIIILYALRSWVCGFVPVSSVHCLPLGMA
jgi:hypothetical protein